MDVSGHTDGCIPTMGHQFYSPLLRHPRDPPHFGEATDLSHIRLDNIHCTTVEVGHKRLAARQHFTVRNLDR